MVMRSKGCASEQYQCKKRHWYWSSWSNNVTLDERKVIFASYSVSNEKPFARL